MRQGIAFIFIFLISFGFQAKEQVQARLSQKEIKVGEQCQLDLSIAYTAGENQLIFPALQDTISKFIEIVDISTIDTTFDEEDVTQKILHQKLIVTSWDSGFHVIPPFLFVLNGDTLETKAMMLSVQNIDVDPQADIKDIKPILEVPFSLSDWILSNRSIIGSIALLILLVFIAILVYRKYFNRAEEQAMESVPKEEADRIAQRKLMELSEAKYWQKGQVKKYYSELSFVMREYLENRFQLQALEQTSDETIESIKPIKEIDKELLIDFNKLLRLADMAKFAKQLPLGSENDEVLKIAFQFVEQTKMQNREAETENNSPEDE